MTRLKGLLQPAAGDSPKEQRRRHFCYRTCLCEAGGSEIGIRPNDAFDTVGQTVPDEDQFDRAHRRPAIAKSRCPLSAPALWLPTKMVAAFVYN